jgi:hypothetical protein
MLKASPALRLAIFVLLALLFAWVVSGSQAFQSCFHENNNTESYRGLYESESVIGKSIIRLWLNAECGLTFFDKDSGALTAIATIAIAWFTWTLWGATTEQGRLTQQAIDLARAEFIGSHRPKIIVRFVQGPFPQFPDPANRPYVWVTVANVGVNRAIIEKFGADLARRVNGQWMFGIEAAPKPVSEIIPNRPSSIILMSGERYVFTVTERPHSSGFVYSKPVGDLCLVGRILYRDDTNVTRETGFFRVSSEGRERFIASNDSEEEYQD